METKPAEVLHPGEHLRDELKARNIYPMQYSYTLDMDTYIVRAIINGKMNITRGIADKLSKALGTSAEFWMNLQRAWDERSKS
jgi:HTH-type transcriptional regulator/antitoxin HigA